MGQGLNHEHALTRRRLMAAVTVSEGINFMNHALKTFVPYTVGGLNGRTGALAVLRVTSAYRGGTERAPILTRHATATIATGSPSPTVCASQAHVPTVAGRLGAPGDIVTHPATGD